MIFRHGGPRGQLCWQTFGQLDGPESRSGGKVKSCQVRLQSRKGGFLFFNPSSINLDLKLNERNNLYEDLGKEKRLACIYCTTREAWSLVLDYFFVFFSTYFSTLISE